MLLGDIIKAYRLNHGKMSMDLFSEKSGISKAYISLLEKNKHPKTGKPIAPSIQVIKQAADAMGMDFDTLFSMLEGEVSLSEQKIVSDPVKTKKGVVINVLGRVAAGIPIEAVTDIIDTEEIPEEMAKTGEFFGLQIHGDSMEPRMCEGDVVIVRQQDDAESGDVVIAMINGNDATCKRLRKYRDGIELISNNPSYDPMFFSNEEIETKPVKIIGKVVELRGKF
ncbi:helix-turn-helix domain-containing protein [Parablautia sp. Marseille-Q6255]|uniref:helix-turn-helix domain-containing protein n=1 Tax=Parablautia sp. Marseille-Q6255 TaxID=3039593 RepID=UPI0024BD1F98|nr:XRE family transcriptional regulator [Parablautia sp. Marseille-Q6255]